MIVTRSFSKGYSLAGIRLGYLVARAEMVEHLIKVKDSYNCDTLSQVAGIAALADQDYLRETRSKIIATRARLTGELRAMGYTVAGQPVQFRLGDGGPAGPRDIPEAQGSQDPGPADDLSGISRWAADHSRHRRGDRPAPGGPETVELSAAGKFRYNRLPVSG